MPNYADIYNTRENHKGKQKLMGMASSQINLLRLTARKNTIGSELNHLSIQKMATTREMRKVSEAYQEALNSKVLKWSNNAGVTYVDLSYKNLMHPSNANQNVPYLITDSSGRIVVDDKYSQYAAMISPDGSAGGDYESVRTKILAGVTGMSEDKLNGAVSTSTELATAKTNLDKIEGDEPTEDISNKDIRSFLKNAGSINGYDVASLYTQGSITLGANASAAASSLTSFVNAFSSKMSTYIPSDYTDIFTQACDDWAKAQGDEFSTLFSQSEDNLKVIGITKNGDNYCYSMSEIIDGIMGAYESAGGLTNTNDRGNIVYGTLTHPQGSTEWNAWKTEHDTWETNYNAALAEYQSALNTDNQSLTADEESTIAFYDQLFTAIAENGWTQNNMVSNTEYLNQMLQNNMYYITTMDTAKDASGNEYYEYYTSPATNIDNIVQVSDSDAEETARAEYEYQKSIINEKESRIDTRQEDLNTELSAINEMIQGIETVKNDNEERTFGIFA